MSFFSADSTSTTLINLNQIQGIPYNIIAKFNSNDTHIDFNTNAWISIDYTNLTTGASSIDLKILPINYPTITGLSQTVEINLYIATTESSPYQVGQSHLMNLTFNSEPATTSVSDVSCTIGKHENINTFSKGIYCYFNHTIQHNKPLTDFTFQWLHANLSTYTSWSVNATGTDIIAWQIGETNSKQFYSSLTSYIDSISSLSLIIRMYYVSNSTRDYPFTVTFTNNSAPFYNSTNSVSWILLRSGVSTNYIFQPSYDTESDTLTYTFNHNLPSPVTYSQNDTNSLNLTFSSVNVGTEGTYYMVVTAHQDVLAYSASENVTVYINALPVESATFPSNPISKTPYSNNAAISMACPWFTDADSDSLTVSDLYWEKLKSA